jgi:dihydrofolate reductase
MDIKICMVAAMDAQGAIGVSNTLPWKCPADMRRFRALTLGRVCLMGRKTAESLPKALRDRVNVVMTRDRTWTRPGFITVHDMRGVKRILKRYEQKELWIIGGGDLYRKFIAKADILHLSILNLTVPNPDTWFPVDGLSRFHGIHYVPVQDPMVDMYVLTPEQIPSTRNKPMNLVEVDS